ncbi:MAG: hypothetical protein TECD_00569 [Hyphomicrobiaceae bacterium hypho_1]
MAFPIIATRNAGLKRLQTFVPNSGSYYTKNRNIDHGDKNRTNISLLSGHLRHRLILESEVLDAVLGRYAPSTAEKFIQEIFWRSYFKGWLEQHPTVWATYRSDVLKLYSELKVNNDLAKCYHQAVNGKTGIACFDSWVQELVNNGYLHNHARMWFASIWIFTLKLPWQLGADFFYYYLIDGDPASNTLSWRWVGGLHTQNKIYLARPSNIEKYTNGRFAPYGQLVSNAYPLEEEKSHLKRALPVITKEIQTESVGLVITEEDGYVEDLFKDFAVTAGIALLSTKKCSQRLISILPQVFIKDMLADSISRAANHFQCTFSGPYEFEDWGPALVDFAKTHNIKTLVTAYAPVGPASEKLIDARSYLAEYGIMLYEKQRRYDKLCWPHATRGFFSLKKKIPDIIEKL